MNSDPENNAPAFYFANQGFDVWLANSRGNKHSLGHIKYNSSVDAAYWQFSFEQMAQYDIPAAFRYVSGATRSNRIHFVGHSEGTAIMFAALSEKNEDIKRNLGRFVAMGPVAFVKNIDSTLIQVVGGTKIMSLLKTLNIYK